MMPKGLVYELVKQLAKAPGKGNVAALLDCGHAAIGFASKFHVGRRTACVVCTKERDRPISDRALIAELQYVVRKARLEVPEIWLRRRHEAPPRSHHKKVPPKPIVKLEPRKRPKPGPDDPRKSICTKCGQEKNISMEFGWRSLVDGTWKANSQCTSCRFASLREKAKAS